MRSRSAYTYSSSDNCINLKALHGLLYSYTLSPVKLIAKFTFYTLFTNCVIACSTFTRLTIPFRVLWAFYINWDATFSFIIPFKASPACFIICTLSTIPSHIWRTSSTDSRTILKESFNTHTFYSIKSTIIRAFRLFRYWRGWWWGCIWLAPS